MKVLLKRIWPVALLLALCMLVLPTCVWAVEAEEEFLIFGWGTQERYSAYSNASGNGWDWQAETRTLTLNNANLGKCIKVPVGTTILLKGDNIIKTDTINGDKESITGDGYFITGDGNLVVDNGIAGSVIFRGTGDIKAAYIGNRYNDGHHIRFESGTISADEISVGVYGNKSAPVDELIIMGGNITVNNIIANRTEVLMTGGTMKVTAEKSVQHLAYFDITGDYKNGEFKGGHFTFTGGNLSVGNTSQKGMALFAEFIYSYEDIGLNYMSSSDEISEYFSSVEPLIKLGDDVKVTGGKLTTELSVDSYTSPYALEDYYAGYGFSNDGKKISYYWQNPTGNFASVITLFASDKKLEQKLWEPTFTPRAVVVSDNTPKEVTNNQTVSAQNGIKIMLNGSSLAFTESPYVANGSTMVPMRVIFEALKAEVNYDAATQKITATKGDTVVELVIGQKSAKKNGQTINLDVAAITRNGNTMVPLRFVAEALNAQVDWDNASQTVSITLNE